ncbi:MAG TPA: quinone-dependent dihydroorotate dehydrogenase [Bacteroidia bacterium]|nr:quinone-dependent dihydroorotate dehydrogenase [Bacteroidia bacterium]
MYKIIRWFLFKLNPESAHHFTFFILNIIFKIPGIGWIFRKNFVLNDAQLGINLFGLHFKNRVGLAAGFDKDAKFYQQLSNFGFGFIEIGTVTPLAQPGNDKPRMFRLPKDKALLNRMGFNNQGVVAAAKRLKEKKAAVIIGGNIGKNKNTSNEDAVHDYLTCFETLYDVVDYFVVNVSSPNTPNLRDLQDKEPLTKLLMNLVELNNKKIKPKPILLKIAPDLSNSQLDDIIEIVDSTKIHGVIATNTTIDRNLLQNEREYALTLGLGGLSGKPLTKRSTEVIKYLFDQSKGAFPIIGVGGIHSADDAIEKIKAGASLVQLYTGFIYEGPSLIKQINYQLLREKIN